MSTIIQGDSPPTLKKESVAFITTTCSAIGAIFGAGLGAAISYRDFKGTAVENILKETLTCAAMSAAIGFLVAKTTNSERDRIRPYVERLEAERDRSALAATNSQTK